MSNAIDIQSLLNRLRAVSETGCDPDLPHEAAVAMEALHRDAEIWYEQAQARTNDAVQFAQERDALAAMLSELEGRDWHDPVAYIDNGTGRPHWCPGALPNSLPHGTKLYARPVPAEPVNARLLAIATGQIRHTYAGLCPDPVSTPNSRDPECPACRVIAAAESALAEPQPDALEQARAEEREACAEACLDEAKDWVRPSHGNAASVMCARRIRDRGERS